MTGGYDEATLRRLGEQLSAQRLLQMLTQLQSAASGLSRSVNRRTDAELCLIRLSDEGLDESFAGLSARIARVEERLAKGLPAAPVPAAKAEPVQVKPASPEEPPPPWEDQAPPPEEELEYVFDLPEDPAARPEPPLRRPRSRLRSGNLVPRLRPFLRPRPLRRIRGAGTVPSGPPLRRACGERCLRR